MARIDFIMYLTCKQFFLIKLFNCIFYRVVTVCFNMCLEKQSYDCLGSAVIVYATALLEILGSSPVWINIFVRSANIYFRV